MALLVHDGVERGSLGSRLLTGEAFPGDFAEQPLAQRFKCLLPFCGARNFRFETLPLGLESFALVRGFKKQLSPLPLAEAVGRTLRSNPKTRADKGVAPIADALQAQKQHEQALFSLTKAESDAQTALGALAADMNLAPDVPLEVAAVTDSLRTDSHFSESVAQMIRDVQDTHRSVRAAQAQYEAALAKVSQTRAQGLPSISLVAEYSRNNQPQSGATGGTITGSNNTISGTQVAGVYEDVYGSNNTVGLGNSSWVNDRGTGDNITVGSSSRVYDFGRGNTFTLGQNSSYGPDTLGQTRNATIYATLGGAGMTLGNGDTAYAE